MTDTDIAYCAGLIDGEGCVRIKRCKPYTHLTGRVNFSYEIAIQVRMVDEPAIAFLQQTLGGWYWKEKKPHSTKGRPLYCWQATAIQAEKIMRIIRPYAKVKTEQIDNALVLRALQANRRQHKTKITGYRNFPNAHGTPRLVPNLAYSDEYIAQCESLYQRSRELNAVGEAALAA